MIRRLAFAGLFAVAFPLFAAREGGPIPLQLPLFPGNNWWNADITNAPTDAESGNMITFINNGGTRRVHPDWGGDVGDGSGETYGIPFIIVDNTQAKVPITFTQYGPESDPGPYPIPNEPITQFGWIEGGEPGNQDPGGDRHMLILNRSDNTLYEMGNVFYNGTGWEASGGAIFHVDSNATRPDTWTSADAAGLAILPGLVRYDEAVDLPEINHAFRVTVRSTRAQYYFPASHQAGSGTTAPWMGMRLRLKSNVNPAGVTDPLALKIIKALKRYGLIVADNGSDMFITGAYDTRWNVMVDPNNSQMDILLSTTKGLGALTASDFDVVQKGWQPPRVLLLTAPLSGGATQTVTVQVVDNASLAAYTGTIHFTSTTAAVLPADFTFTAGVTSHDFVISGLPAGYTSITATDTTPGTTITGSVLLSSGPRPPTGVDAKVTGTTQVTVSWEAPAGGAASYIVQRRTPSTAYATSTCTMSGTTCTDLNAPGPAAYIYRVCSVSVSTSTCSLPDVAGNFTFTDDPIVPGVTRVQAAHITQLQAAANAMLATPRSFTAASSNTTILATQLQEISDAIDAARAALGLPPFRRHDAAYDNTVTIKAPNVQELRDATK